MADRVYLMSSNRCDCKIVPYLGQFLFDFEDGQVRNHWDDRPFRKLYRRAVLSARQQGQNLRGLFLQAFWRALYQFHWILPYPCGVAMMQAMKQGLRMWYSIQPQGGVVASEAAAKDWK
jgi:hypothetical protein